MQDLALTVMVIVRFLAIVRLAIVRLVGTGLLMVYIIMWNNSCSVKSGELTYQGSSLSLKIKQFSLKK